MHTILHKEIDGFKVVQGFAKACVDPLETKAVVEALIEKEPSKIEADRLSIDINLAWQKLVKLSRTKGTPPEAIEKAKGELEAKQEAIKAPLKTIAQKRDEFFAANLVYCNPGPKAQLATAEQVEALQAVEVPAGHVLLTSGETILDQRGEFFWSKKSGHWTKTKIKTLGLKLPKGTALFGDLSEADQAEALTQYKANPQSTLNPNDLLAEYEEKKKAALKRLEVSLRKLKAEGDPEAEQKVEAMKSKAMGALIEKYKIPQ